MFDHEKLIHQTRNKDETKIVFKVLKNILLVILLILLGVFIHMQFLNRLNYQEIPIESSTEIENFKISDKTGTDQETLNKSSNTKALEIVSSTSSYEISSITQEIFDYVDIEDVTTETQIAKETENPFKSHRNYKMLANVPKLFQISRTRVQHGDLTEIGEFPWIVAFFSVSKKKLFASPVCSCAGSLISDSYILSAAHCFPTHESDIKMVSIRLGEYNISSDTDCNSNGYCAEPIQEYFEGHFVTTIHSDYNHNTKQNDIALTKLSFPAKTNQKNIKPIRLPFDNSGQIPSRVQVAGWGYTENGKLPNVLMKGFLNATPHNECHKFYDKTLGYNTTLTLSKNQFCAKGKHKKLNNASIQTCRGDSGGPAFSFDIHEFFFIINGITSWGVLNEYARCGHDRAPTVFVNVYEYIGWIMDHV